MSIDKTEFKKQVLELIKSDEEFRLAIASAIGYHVLLEEIKNLRKDFNTMYSEFNKRFEVIEMKLFGHDREFNEIIERLARIELQLSALTESFYSMALWDDLKEEISSNGERILFKRREHRIGDSVTDLFIETDKRVYVVEVKVKPRYEDVGILLAKVDLVKKHYPDKEVIAILAGALIERGVEEYALEKGVLIRMY